MKFVNPTKVSNDGMEIWFNPVDQKSYETNGAPEHGFTSEINATPIFDSVIYKNNLRIAESARIDGTLNQNTYDSMASPAIESELDKAITEYNSLVRQPSKFKEAMLLSVANPSVNVVKIESHLYGRKDRRYAGRELAHTYASDALITNIDKVIKMGGMEQIREGQLPRDKDIKYERVFLETLKYGLAIKVTDEAVRKNVHNPYEDSIQVAATKEAQRKAYDTIAALNSELTGVTVDNWDTYVAGTDRSTNDPTIKLTALIQATIEGTNVGGNFSHLGVNKVGGKIWDNNSFNRGALAKADSVNFEPGTRELKNVDGVTMVNDQFIPQGIAYAVDATAEEACCVFIEGPSTVGTDVDLIKTRTYVALSYHLAKVINPDTGRKLLGAYTPISST